MNTKATQPKPAPAAPAAAPVPRIFRVADLAARWGCSAEHVQDLIDEGQLQAIDIGHGSRRFWRIPVEAVAGFERVNSSLFDRTTGQVLPARKVEGHGR